MCGRFTRDYSWADVHTFLSMFPLLAPEQDPTPAYNIAPTQASWVLVPEGQGARAVEMRWGLVPAWAKDLRLAANTINARIESADSKPSFRAAWKSRRCLVPASGYYEWRLEAGLKQPYYIHPARERLFMLAGLWESWRSPEGQALQTFAILTQDSSGPLTAVHDRAPLFLRPEVCFDWMTGSPEQAAAIAASAPLPALQWHAVSRAVNSSRSQGARLIEPDPGAGGLFGPA